ncbi:hypothetical protein Bbelb_168320 [Branchiostoma belcheri]|nr:hypothetical protein Bbelb_168320 [Branchiostoma belcheri]
MAEFSVVTASNVNVQISSSLSSFGSEKRFDKSLTIGALKMKLELITGCPAAHMDLQVFTKENKLVTTMDNNDALLGSYPVDDGMRIHVVNKDASIQVGDFEDVSKVEKYEMKDEDYEKKQDSVLGWKKRNKLGRPKKKDKTKSSAHEGDSGSLSEDQTGRNGKRSGLFPNASQEKFLAVEKTGVSAQASGQEEEDWRFGGKREELQPHSAVWERNAPSALAPGTSAAWERNAPLALAPGTSVKEGDGAELPPPRPKFPPDSEELGSPTMPKLGGEKSPPPPPPSETPFPPGFDAASFLQWISSSLGLPQASSSSRQPRDVDGAVASTSRAGVVGSGESIQVLKWKSVRRREKSPFLTLTKAGQRNSRCICESRGGNKVARLAALALEMWSWALERGLTLSATHVPGLTNTLADRCSRVFSGQVWESQAWYPKVLNMLFESPVLLPQSWDLLFLPHNRRPHPLLPDLMLAAWPRSGDSCRVGAFRQGLQTSSSRLGEKALLDSISQHGLSGPADQGNLPESVLGGLPAGQALVCLHIPERISKADFFPSERRGGEQKLFISFSRPHRPVGSATLARWVKSVLGTAGVDTATFSAHSTRGASTSAATAAGVSLHSIMNAADWSRESTFLKYYRRDNNQHTFCQAVLSTALKSA